jgi:hypothetical protein
LICVGGEKMALAICIICLQLIFWVISIADPNENIVQSAKTFFNKRFPFEWFFLFQLIIFLFLFFSLRGILGFLYSLPNSTPYQQREQIEIDTLKHNLEVAKGQCKQINR